ncbi:cob(I)yrinic acid a,c-diamide adenosyltransferase [Candidatus Pacearchaeota archaeon]|nr:cob(I)yrinic acid a,c-diamide adenosyltransferase [Candidatus Pacearchaeota archaeon]
MDKSGLGMLSIFWGNGKGKSTSAFGTALRACGNGYKVHLVQFMKNGTGDIEIDYPGEIKALEKFPNFSFKRFGTGSWVIGKPSNEHIAAVKQAFDYLKECMEQEYDIIIADELLYAIQLKLIEEDEVIDFLKSRDKKKDLILTGSHIPFPRIFELADLVTEIKKIKHPYDSGTLARKGLEY